MDDYAKINAIIEECVDPQEMWNLLDGSLDAFSEEVKLDGGFVLPALLSASTGYEDFAKVWNRQFSIALHRVRNALVHARESRQSTMIAPNNCQSHTIVSVASSTGSNCREGYAIQQSMTLWLR